MPQIAPLLAIGAEFRMIEIEPLLAFQFVIDAERSGQHCDNLTHPPTGTELLDLCLPLNGPVDDWKISPGPSSMMIRSRSLNLGIHAAGPLVLPNLPNLVGVQFGWSVPLLHVVRYNGRCYLHNGYHRAFGAAKAGATEVACIFREVGSPAEAAIMPPMTLPLDVLESNKPPTLGHFVRGAAWDVQLRRAARIIQVSWSQHAVFEE